jgi:hypothetical protein
MTMKIHYCFGDFRLLKVGGKQRKDVAGRLRKSKVA